MDALTQGRTGREIPLSPEEIGSQMIRCDFKVASLIARCEDRKMQDWLINLWNDPWEFDRFLEITADIAGKMNH